MLLVFLDIETAPAYHEICKYLMNFPLAKDFTKTPLVVYQNLLKEFWCTAVATHINPPADDSKVRPLKECKIKFFVMNGKKPLTLNYKKFVEFTGVDYAKGTYVTHPSPKAVLGRNYLPTEQVGSIQQLLIYCLLTWAKGLQDPRLLPQKRKKLSPKRHPVRQGLPSILDRGTRKSKPLPKGTNIDPKDLGGNVQPVDMGLTSTYFDEGVAKTTLGTNAKYQVDETQSTRLRYRSLTKNKGKTSSEVEPDIEPLKLQTFAHVQAFLLFKNEMAQKSDDDEAFEAREDREEETQADKEPHQSPPPNTDKSKPSPDQETQESESDSSSPELKKYNNMEQSDKVIDAAMNSLDKNSIARGDLLNSINGVTYTLKVSLQPSQAVYQRPHLLSLKGQKMLGENVTRANTKEPPSHTKGEHVTIEDDAEKLESDKAEEEPTRAIPISIAKPITRPNPEVTMIESSSRPLLTDPTLVIPDPDETIKVPYMINGKMHYITNDEINSHLEKEDKIKKVVEEAKMFEMTKTEVIKVVQEEAKKIRLDPKMIISAKARGKFKKAYDVEHHVLKREHS
nr:hypothetical protein [Tanacetum cinerariifolium]